MPSDSRIKLLVVDEDALDRRSIVRHVETEQLPFDVASVFSLAAAGSLLNRHAFDVAIIDQRLADGVGTTVLSELIGTPIIVFARPGDEAAAAMSMHAGVYGCIVRDAARRYLALLAPTITSVLARRRAEIAAAMRAEDLVRTTADFQRLASMMWHETMEPLTTLLSATEALQDDLDRNPDAVPADARAAVAQSIDAASRLERLLTDVLGFFRLHAAPTLVPVDLHKLVADVVSTLPASEWGDATVDVGQLPCVTGDPVRLRLLFRRLLDSAQRRRGKDALAVHVWAAVYDGTLRVTVSDNGAELPPADFERALYHEHHPIADDTTLGMAIARRIVEQHGGRLWYESQAPYGATVQLTLPTSALPAMCIGA